MTETDYVFILIASFGAAIQELMYWFELRYYLGDKKKWEALKSIRYWTVTILMIISSGLGTWILYDETLTIKSAQFILGAAFPMIFKKLVKQMNSQSTQLGINFTIKDYFQI